MTELKTKNSGRYQNVYKERKNRSGCIDITDALCQKLNFAEAFQFPRKTFNKKNEKFFNKISKNIVIKF